ncbi:MAG: serine hydrolase, partial [Planctomycetota bacterium]
MIRERCPELVALLAVVIAHACCTSLTAGQEPNTASAFDRQALLEMMAEHEIPGLAVAVTHRGNDYDCNLGVADRESSVAVTRETIFEIGSVSKVFTAIAAALADQNGTISLEAPIGRYMDELAGTPLGSVPVYHLATHTAGGFPLQVPERVDSEASLIEYYREWEPQHPPGTRRHYANPSVGLLGLLVARASGTTYAELMESGLFEDLGLGSTYIRVPRNALDKYAWGYNRAGERVRVNPAPLA